MSKQKNWFFSKLFYRSLEMLLHEITSGSFTNPSAWEIYATQIHLFPANCTFISSSHRCKAVQAGVGSGASQAVLHAPPPVPNPHHSATQPSQEARLPSLLLMFWEKKNLEPTVLEQERTGNPSSCFISGSCHWHAVQL